MKKIFCLTVLIVSMVASIVAAQPQSPPQSSIITSLTDSAQLLEIDQRQTLIDKIKSIETKHGVRVGIVTLKSARGLEINTIADNLLDDYFSGAPNGSIALIIIMDTRQWHISTDAQMKRRITTEDGIPYLQNAFQSILTQGNYYAAFDTYLNAIDEQLTYYEQNDAPYGRSSGGFDPLALVGAIFAGVASGGAARSSMIGAMSNVKPAVEAIDYLDKKSVKLTETRDIFLFSHVTRQSKGGGGHGAHGGGGGGGSHGGGGGSF